MNVVGIIPARLAASRFPNKPLKTMLGMPMIGHCYHRTCLADGIDDVYVATCDEEIANYVRTIGGKAVMTSTEHTRATTRTAEALEIIEQEIGKKIDMIVMVQGDEPLIAPAAIAETVPHFSDETVNIVNIMSLFQTEEALKDENNVKVVVDQNDNALYFSREVIPSLWKNDNVPRYMQTGIIAFRRETLLSFNAMTETSLEIVESVDMNRVLETGGRIRMVRTNGISLGVDTKEEMEMATQLLKDDPITEKYL